MTKETEEVVVLETDSKQEIDYETKIKMLENSRLNIVLPNAVHAQLNDQAEFRGKTIEEYCTEILKNTLQTTAGAPIITGPSNLSGKNVIGRKITGPSNLAHLGT